GDALGVDLVVHLLHLRLAHLGEQLLALALEGRRLDHRRVLDLALLVDDAGADFLHRVERRFGHFRLAAGADARAAHPGALLLRVALAPLALVVAPLDLAALVPAVLVTAIAALALALAGGLRLGEL